jgi:hypothetical protein
VAQLKVRWSEHEARKDYARPFGVGFLDDNGDQITAIAVNGRELLYYRDFQAAVFTLLGELFLHPDVEASPEPQFTWLEIVASLLPAIDQPELAAASTFDNYEGRTVQVDVRSGGETLTTVPTAAVFDYQEFQAVVAHQTGQLLRLRNIEETMDDLARSRAWTTWVADHMRGLDEEFAVVSDWPWNARLTKKR